MKKGNSQVSFVEKFQEELKNLSTKDILAAVLALAVISLSLSFFVVQITSMRSKMMLESYNMSQKGN